MTPGVPGMAQGRASVSGSRLYGQKIGVPSASAWLGSVVKPNSADRSGSESTSGILKGSAPLAR